MLLTASPLLSVVVLPQIGRGDLIFQRVLQIPDNLLVFGHRLFGTIARKMLVNHRPNSAPVVAVSAGPSRE
jgi:hypothetical protein